MRYLSYYKETEEETDWHNTIQRNDISYMWQKRFLPGYYNVVERSSGECNTDVFGDFPLCFNFISYLEDQKKICDFKISFLILLILP